MISEPKGGASAVVMDFLAFLRLRFFCHVEAKVGFWQNTVENLSMGPRTGAILSPCLTPTLKLMDVYTFPMMILNMLLLYMRLIAEHSLGGAPYFPSMAISARLEVSKALTMSENSTHFGRLWVCLRCRSVLIVNVPSWNPTPDVDPNWHFTPCLLIILNSRLYMILM